MDVFISRSQTLGLAFLFSFFGLSEFESENCFSFSSELSVFRRYKTVKADIGVMIRKF